MYSAAMIYAQVWGYHGNVSAQFSQLLLTGHSLASSDFACFISKEDNCITWHFSFPETRLLCFSVVSLALKADLTVQQLLNKQNIKNQNLLKHSTSMENMKEILSLTFTSILCHYDSADFKSSNFY